ncbi:hypothetical protein F751_4653 [Auxenochlorella protothecoides]|uniref:Uncharacterized protein n=1 Tax=Auxenochlorella protothecoides TaxID=3075 RepID=A0A087SKA6_AUXPR|nr:hypothetical protein F751_4653 [Auxenochlorella protothecoides]KFM26160.1 hypothetical protein F751_4653 [Auxenochlorella protothecoides]
MDGAAFPELHSIVAASDDPRIWVFAEWIGPDFAAKTEDGMWSPYYHALLYNLTDDAVFACPEDTTWLLVTNGDNEYADSFLARAAAEAARGSADVVAFDFYSRYQRPTAPQCDRLATLPAPAPACKRNRLAWCHTDLGAYVLRYARFLRERRGFGAGARAVAAPDLGAEHADGLLAAALAADGWAAAHVTDACLFSHSPSPQACAWGGGVWDDRDMMTWQAGGGACVSRQDLDWIMEHDPGAEVVAVALSSDGDIAGRRRGGEERGGRVCGVGLCGRGARRAGGEVAGVLASDADGRVEGGECLHVMGRPPHASLLPEGTKISSWAFCGEGQAHSAFRGRAAPCLSCVLHRRPAQHDDTCSQYPILSCAGFGSAAGTTAVDAAGQLTIQCIRRRDYLSEEVWGGGHGLGAEHYTPAGSHPVMVKGSGIKSGQAKKQGTRQRLINEGGA